MFEVKLLIEFDIIQISIAFWSIIKLNNLLHFFNCIKSLIDKYETTDNWKHFIKLLEDSILISWLKDWEDDKLDIFELREGLLEDLLMGLLLCCK